MTSVSPDYGSVPTAPLNQGIDDLPATGGAAFNASLAETVEDLPESKIARLGDIARAKGATPSAPLAYAPPAPIGEAAQRERAGKLGQAAAGPSIMDSLASTPEAIAAPQPQFPPSPVTLTPEIPIAQAKQRLKAANLDKAVTLPDAGTIREGALDLMMNHARTQAEREATIAAGPKGFIPSALDVGTSLFVGAVDPTNIAAFSIPVLGEARYGMLLRSAGQSMLARAAVRAGVGAGQGALGSAVLTPLDWATATAEGRDYTFSNALSDMIQNAGVGALMHAGPGLVADTYRRLRGRELEVPHARPSAAPPAEAGGPAPEAPAQAAPAPQERPQGGNAPAGRAAASGEARADRTSPEAGQVAAPVEQARDVEIERQRAAEEEWNRLAATEPAAAPERAIANGIPGGEGTGPARGAPAEGEGGAAAEAPVQAASPDLAIPDREEQAYAALPERAREDAMHAANAALINGEPVQAAEMLAAAATQDPRIGAALEAYVANAAREAIFADVKAKLLEAGLGEEEANANAAVWAARYVTRAARLGADAQALYRAEGLEIARGRHAPPPAVAERRKRKREPVGLNRDGKVILEDANGVHSFVEDGVRVTEPVTINPRTGELAVDRDRHPEFAVVKPLDVAPTSDLEAAIADGRERLRQEIAEGPGPASADLPAAIAERREQLREEIAQGSSQAPTPPPAEIEDIRSMLDRGASIEEIAAHPAFAEAEAKMAAVPPTDSLWKPIYSGSHERVPNRQWMDSRTFVFGDEWKVGYEEGVKELQRLAEAYSTEGPVLADRQAFIVIGPPAAGKSTVAERIARNARAAIVDSDDAKKVLPEYEGGIGASAVHEESAFISGMVMSRQMSKDHNLVIPKVGHKVEGVAQLIDHLHNHGYDVHLVNMDVAEAEAFRRMVRRFLDTGRLINPNYFRTIDGGPKRAYEALKNDPRIVSHAEVDANGPRHQQPVSGTGAAAQALREPGWEGGTVNRPDVAGDRVRGQGEAGAREEGAGGGLTAAESIQEGPRAPVEDIGDKPPDGPVLVFRLGSAEGGLGGRNAGNLRAVVRHLLNMADDEGPGNVGGYGDTISVYEVNLPKELVDYQSIVGKSANRPGGGIHQVGRNVITERGGLRRKQVGYSFPEGFKAKKIDAIPVARVAEVLKEQKGYSIGEAGWDSLEDAVRLAWDKIRAERAPATAEPQSSEAGIPMREASSAETGLAEPGMNSSSEAPPAVQPEPGFQVSTRIPPPSAETTREMLPSIFEGPAITRFADLRLGDIDPSSNRRIIQSSDDYKALLAAAEENKPKLVERLKELAAGVEGAEVYGARVKDLPGLEQKIKAKGRPASTISDYLGARVLVDTPAALQEFLARLQATGAILEDENFLGTPKEGYRAYHLQLSLGDGTSAELQLVPKAIFEVMNAAHALRQPVKRLDLSDPANVATFEREMAKGRALFDDAWAARPDWLAYVGETAEGRPETGIPASSEATANEQGGTGLREPVGEGLGEGAPSVPEGGGAGGPAKPKRIRKPRTIPEGNGQPSEREGEPHDGGPSREPGGSEPAAPAEGEGVTKPPRGDSGTDPARPDTPAGAGLSEANQRIAERSRSNYRITDSDQIGQGGPKAKIRANIEAIRVLKQIEDEARDATPEEKTILVKYTGWGAFSQKMFADRYGEMNEFKPERDALRALVTDEEFASARASTLNAHYTSPDVIKGMWSVLKFLGYKGGLALEPSAGVGHFIGLIPDDIAGKTAWTGVELDSLTGRIAKALYGGAEINVHGFEDLKRPSNHYDLAISNVPFGNYALREEPYGAYPIHDFFFVKSLDKIRPGGIVAFVTSRYTMDRVDDATRRQLAKTADLVGAIRLPGGNKGAFAKNAGTEVTTDIILLRKKIPGEEPFPGEDWMDLKEVKTPDGPVKINEYFAAHPEKMLGEIRLQGTMHAKDEPVLIGDTDNLDQKIRDAAAGMREGAFVERVAPRPPPVHANDVDRKIKEGGFFEKDGVIYRRMQGAGENAKLPTADAARVSKLIGMRDLYNDLLAEQLSPAHDAKKADALREALREAYDAFVGEYGPINKTVTTTTKRLNKAGEPVTITKQPNFDAFRSDPDAWKVAAIENYDPETGVAKRADVQVKDVLNAPTERKINGPADALAAVLDETGGVDLNRVGEMLGVGTEEEAAARLGDLIFQNPDGRQWETVDKYLSGDVVKKLEEARVIARSDPGYLRNVAALEKVQPTPLTGTDITAQLGAPWVPEDVYETFIEEIGGVKPVVTKLPATGAFRLNVEYFTREAEAKYGTDRVKMKDLVEAALNNRQVSVYDTIDDKRVLNQKETEAARIKTELLRETFGGDVERGVEAWAFAEPERAARLEAIYNRTYNNLAPRQFDGSHLTFPGLNEKFADRWYRKNAVWRIVQNGNTLLAHEVGSGKTVTMIASGMEMRRLGIIRKPAYVVPNHMLEQFSREFIEAYPNAKILVAQKDEMTRDNRREFIAKIAANDWDGVIITHDAFGRINMGRDFRERFIREQMADLERAREAEADEAGAKAPSVKDLEKAKKKLETRLEALLNEDRKDAGTSFEETGIDHLFVDEAHKFKNLAFVTRLTRVKGLAQGDSQRAEDLFLKMRYLEQNRPGRSAVFATGTPVSNTMAELWTMMRYLELDRLKQAGLDHFDAWASTFGKVVNTMELSADGRTFKEVSSFSKFVNVPELISLYSEISDTKTADMLKLKRPEVRTRSGAPGIEIVEATPSEAEEKHIQHLVELAESLKGKRPEPGQPNMLSVVTEGRKVATDGRLVNPDFDFNPRGKIALAVDNIYRIWKEGKEPGMVQMVFLDMGVPQTRGARRAAAPDDGEGGDPAQGQPARTDLYADIKDRLVAKGIPANEIAAIHDAKDDAAKGRLFAKVRTGEVRVFLGSSEKMGVGTNVQDKLIAMHHLDAPWKPAEVAQRDGRIVRQGNRNPVVQMYRYVTKRSFDAFMWQKLDTKSKFIGQVLSGSKGSRHAEDIDNPLPEAAEMKAAASGDPRIMELAELDRSVRALTAQRRVHEATVQRATWESKATQSRIQDYERALPSAEADAKKVTNLSGDKFVVEINGKPVFDRKEAGEQIMKRLLALRQAEFFRPTVVKLGRISGFEMNIELRAAYDDGYYLNGTPMLKGEVVHSATNTVVINQHTDPGGLIRRYESMLMRVADQPQRLAALLAQDRATVEKLAGTLGAKWPRQAEYQEALAKVKALTDAMKAPTHPDVAEDANAQAQVNKPLAAEQPGVAGPEPRGMIELRQGVALIKLFETADRSTIMHESAHLWLDELMRDAETAPPGQIQADRDAVLEWLGVKSRDEIGPAQHEKWALAFEQYLADGRAPSGFLAQAFENFKRWLIEIYHSLTGMGARVPDDIRGVMDRMIATDEEIAARDRPPAIAEASPPIDKATAAEQGWASLQDGKGDPDGEEITAYSQAAEAAPEPASVEGFAKAQTALEKSAADAEAAWREVEPFMEPEERDAINAALLRTTEDDVQRATALRELVGCLLVATS